MEGESRVCSSNCVGNVPMYTSAGSSCVAAGIVLFKAELKQFVSREESALFIRNNYGGG